MLPEPATLTRVPGLKVGHAQVPGGGSGCTVVLGPFRGAVQRSGMATGTRELAVLDPHHVVPRVDAILLTGGSAFGLDAAAGVMEWLEDQGRGFRTSAGPVPIVPGAVIFDLAPGRERPGAAQGLSACRAASSEPVARGRVGAGTGARAGKVLGADRSSEGGLGSACIQVGSWQMGALAVVNSLGDVLDREGRIVAGARDASGDWASSSARILERVREGGFDDGGVDRAGTHTTLAVVATDAPLSRTDLGRLATMASTGMARRISPVHTLFDGDVTFALSTAEETEAFSPAELLSLGVAGREALESAILDAVDPDHRS
jgi:L-aminopeptidase/D-esterase-like protein